MREERIINELSAGVYEAYKRCFNVKRKSVYNKLSPAEQERNRSAANHIPKMLSRVGLSMVPDHPDLIETKLEDDIIEKLAELEHNRWLKENIAMGKSYGGNREKNENPNMLPWLKVSPEKLKELPDRLVAAVGEKNLLEKILDDKVKQRNKCFINEILEHVKRVGFKIVKLQ
jgi:hypothetical protein